MLFRTCATAFQLIRRYPRVSLFFYGVNLLFSAILLWPLRQSIEATVGHSLFAHRLNAGLTLPFLTEFLTHHSAEFSAATALLPLAVVGAFGAGLLISTGALALFLGDEGYDSARFWGTAFSTFGRMLRLSLWMALLWLFGALLVIGGNALRALLLPAGAPESTRFWSYAPVAGMALLIGLFLLTLYDWAQADIVARGESCSRRSLLRALRQVGRRPLPVGGFVCAALALGLVAWLAYRLTTVSLGFTGWVGAAAFILVQQLTLLWRQTAKAFRFAGVAVLYSQAALPAASLPAQPVGEEAPGEDNAPIKSAAGEPVEDTVREGEGSLPVEAEVPGAEGAPASSRDEG